MFSLIHFLRELHRAFSIRLAVFVFIASYCLICFVMSFLSSLCSCASLLFFLPVFPSLFWIYISISLHISLSLSLSIPLSLYLSIYLSIYPSIHLCIYPSIYLSPISTALCIYRSISIYLFVYLSPSAIYISLQPHPTPTQLNFQPQLRMSFEAYSFTASNLNSIYLTLALSLYLSVCLGAQLIQKKALNGIFGVRALFSARLGTNSFECPNSGHLRLAPSRWLPETFRALFRQKHSSTTFSINWAFRCI